MKTVTIKKTFQIGSWVEIELADDQSPEELLTLLNEIKDSDFVKYGEIEEDTEIVDRSRRAIGKVVECFVSNHFGEDLSDVP